MPKVLNKRRDKIPPEAIYVGRPSKWGNPYKIGDKIPSTFKELRPLTRIDCVVIHSLWILGGPGEGDRLKDIGELRGKDLVCWCSPLPCHADILLELANKEEL
ncbi:hypothetical protein LCGC14_0970960 [marine sediment metagenome]|uniref:DUF4326 domain-containing protein n=1 Tax=marine sediment metagenome TaxID=412755 RepID=A0A0F9RI39_9ZZZZ